MRRHYRKVSPVDLQRVFCVELKGLIPFVAIGRSLGVDAIVRLLGLMIG